MLTYRQISTTIELSTLPAKCDDRAKREAKKRKHHAGKTFTFIIRIKYEFTEFIRLAFRVNGLN